MIVSPAHLLIADDSDYGVEVTASCERAGAIPALCTTGLAAIDVVRYEPIAAAIISLRLSDNRGDGVFYRIVALQPLLRHRTILLTTSPAEVRIAKMTGCVWMSKAQDPALVVQMAINYAFSVVQTQEIAYKH